jgi:hypothetical protein
MRFTGSEREREEIASEDANGFETSSRNQQV